MSLDPSIIGKQYRSLPFAVEAHETIYFALATGDDHPAYFDPQRAGGIIAPPMYAARYCRGPLIRIREDASVGLHPSKLVHYSQAFHWKHPVRPGDRIVSEATITHVHAREKGTILGVEIVATNQEGVAVVEAHAELFDLSAGHAGARKDARRSKVPPSLLPERSLFEEEVRIPLWQTRAYAEASQDHSPIHLDDAVARQAGLPGIIVHGMCTMAFAHRIAVKALCLPDQNPLRLTRLKAQLSRPVRPGQRLRFRGYAVDEQSDGKKFALLAENDAGEEVLRHTWCLIS